MFRLLALMSALLHQPSAPLDEHLRYWQPRLNLQDWQISVRVVSARELAANTLGDVEPFMGEKKAVVRILREEDSDLPPRLARAEQRVTLLHELVHLHRRITLSGQSWRDERATEEQTIVLLRANHRWRELAAIEGL